MPKLWVNNKRAVLTSNKAILCGECPCNTCCHPDYIILTNEVISIEPAGAFDNVNGVWAMPLIGDVDGWLTYGFSNTSQYMRLQCKAYQAPTIYQSQVRFIIWDDGYEPGPKWSWTVNDINFCDINTGSINTVSDRKRLIMNWSYEPIYD